MKREIEEETYKKIDKAILMVAYLFLMIPILIILMFWFKPIVSLICSALLVVTYILLVKSIKYKKLEEYKEIFNLKKMAIFFALIIIINILSGAGGICYQNWDYKGRNAMLHDLIDNEWPVKYDYSNLDYEKNKIGSEEGVFSYYFAFWMPAALIGKITNFTFASFFMLLWQILGTSLFFYLIFRKLNKIRIRYFAIFLAFGGLDIITKVIVDATNGIFTCPIGMEHIDTANGKFVMSTFVTQLFWVFNQAIPAWVATMLLINDMQYKNIAVMLAMLVPYSPFPVVGLAIYILIVCIFGYNLDKKINIKRIKELISIQNVCGVLMVIPIGLLFMQNSSPKGCFWIDAINNGQANLVLIRYLMFIVFEFGVYAVIINRENWKKIMVYFIIFAVLPMFYIGGGLDLGNRATIPILVLLYIEILNYIEYEHKKKWCEISLIVILCIAFFTNFNELYRSIKNTYEYRNKGESIFNDSYITFSQFENKECDTFIKNFVAPYDKEKNFYKYILK